MVYPDALYDCVQADLFNEEASQAFSDASSRAVAVQLLKEKLLSKYEGKRSEATKKAAVDKFISTNQRCKSLRVCSQTSTDDLLVGNLRMVLERFFNESGDKTIFDIDMDAIRWRVGPGSSFKGSDINIFNKMFEGPLAGCTRYVARLYDELVKRNPSWLTAEIGRTIHYGNVVITGNAKLDVVPKNEATDRTIMVEPALNTFFQLMAGDCIEHRLKTYFGIHIDSGASSDVSEGSRGRGPQADQNRELCSRYSLSNEGVTIDLASASDSMSIGVLREILPKRILEYLLLLRSGRVVIDGETRQLYMIGTMGNGFTFPLQTTLFASVVAAAYLAKGMTPETHSNKNWGVFGDDIIVPKFLSASVIRLLTILGFEVNTAKSFFEGPFRESCGVDSFKGVNVRPVYIKRLERKQDLFVAINRLLEWCVVHGVRLDSTLALLRKRCRGDTFVPIADPYDSGIRVPLSCLTSKRFNRNGSFIYHSYLPLAREKKVLGASVKNFGGILLSALYGLGGGSTERVAIKAPSKRIPKRYRRLNRVTPNWDYLDPVVDTLSVDERRRWKATLGLYLEIG